MKFPLSTLLVFVFLSSCEKTEKKVENTIETKTDSIKQIEVTTHMQEPVLSRGLDTNLSERQESLNSHFYSAQLYELTDTLKEDFNGDGFIDYAQFLHLAKTGVLITDGKTNKQTKIGLGVAIKGTGDDLRWVDYWGLVRDSCTFEVLIQNAEIVGDTIVRLDHPSIVVRKEEVGGGVITFKKGQYEWVHQSD